MPSEPVPSLLLQAGDVIHVWHRHHCQGGECLSQWEIDATVTEDPAPVGRRVAVKWAHRAWPGTAAITGISLFRPDERVLRIRQPSPGIQHEHRAPRPVRPDRVITDRVRLRGWLAAHAGGQSMPGPGAAFRSGPGGHDRPDEVFSASVRGTGGESP